MGLSENASLSLTLLQVLHTSEAPSEISTLGLISPLSRLEPDSCSRTPWSLALPSSPAKPSCLIRGEKARLWWGKAGCCSRVVSCIFVFAYLCICSRVVSCRVATRFVTLSLIGWCITRWCTCDMPDDAPAICLMQVHSLKHGGLSTLAPPAPAQSPHAQHF